MLEFSSPISKSYFLGQRFSNFTVHQNSLEGLLKQITGPCQSLWLSSIEVGPENLHFSQIPSGCWCFFLHWNPCSRRNPKLIPVGPEQGNIHPNNKKAIFILLWDLLNPKSNINARLSLFLYLTYMTLKKKAPFSWKTEKCRWTQRFPTVEEDNQELGPPGSRPTSHGMEQGPCL